MIANYHVFLNPSRHAADGDAEGGFPVILTELMASGMPIVATDHCDAPELVRDGETGLIAEENNVPMLTEKLADMLNDTGRWGSFTKNGRALVEAEYNAVVQTTRLEAIYDRVIRGV
jgi:colanic acid/amylovoran biosynthesis glycosyltransferase